MRRNIFIATPSYHTPVGGYYASMLSTICALEAAGHLVKWKEWEKCCYVHTARNKLCNEFLFSDCEDLLFIDNDLAWRAADIVRLVSYDFPIVGAAAPFRHGAGGFPAALFRDKEDRPIRDPESGLLNAIVLPTAIMKIQRKVLMKMALEGHAPLRIEYRAFKEEGRYRSFFDFHVDEKSQCELGEDVTFCHKWMKCGGKILIDPDFEISHYGESFRTGNLKEHIEREIAAKEASKPVPETTSAAA